MALSRCAIITLVRARGSLPMASVTAVSFSVSRALVASSMSSMGAGLSRARAMLTR
ncbi:Uncharacterised protein [Mycobacteroides abscessus subsp. abscessus]|nr:Uncharacterised protein [Mycobacteroides abscessus subsp. abscessus]